MPMAGNYTVRETKYTGGGTPGNVIVALADPNRVVLIFSAIGLSTLAVSTKEQSGANQGMFIGTNGGVREITYHTHGDLCLVQWNCFMGLADTIFVFEVFENANMCRLDRIGE